MNFIRTAVLLLSICLPLSGIARAADANKLPLVYRDEYNLHMFGLEKFHHFDTARYGKVYDHLVTTLALPANAFYSPEPATRDDLLLVHSPKYLASLDSPSNVAFILGLKAVRWAPKFFIRRYVQRPMLYATGGTILAANLALERGWSINIGGGYHHAKAEFGGGSCLYDDLAIAARKLWQTKPILKILIVDLDAHQGNGIASIMGDDPRSAIFNVYNGMIYPWDLNARKFIKYNFPIDETMMDDEYLSLLSRELPRAIDAEKPELIMYNAGTDIFVEDTLGKMHITENGIIKRDEIVFRAAIERHIPITMVMSGGYTPRSALIVGRSIENLYTTLLKDYSPEQSKPHGKK